LDDHMHGGITALHSGESKTHTVLDFVFAPPAPGRYKIEVETGETTLLYDVSVRPSDALGGLLFRAPDGGVFALHGRERRSVPDADTLRALGYPSYAVVDAAASFLETLPEGAPLPLLRDGQIVRAHDHPAVFKLEGGRRAWQRDFAPPAGDDIAGSAPFVQTIDGAVLAAIPPVLQHNMLLKSDGADVFHVDGAALRKVPDWKWATERKLNPSDTFYVPERILFGLAQNSPHWITPGGAFEDQSFESDALDRRLPYRVFLPPDYYAASRAGQRYPVIYLLHGMGGRYDEWSGYGVEEVANLLLNERKIGQAIIVAPQGGLGYWMNQDGGTPWGDYVARDLVKHIDATYRTVARREARAVGGLSMGGHGALQLALNFPEVFAVVGAHSASIRPESQAPRYFGRGGGFARRDPLTLALDSQLSSPPRIWLDAGDDDHWRFPLHELHEILEKKGWEHEYHVYEGGHDGWYWGDHIWDYLPFYARAFEKNGIPLVR
ncbi:MAG TPA: alpha/beta hydrolase-fold protein, partial [Chloroflexota bacterium]|nr:alpha/beta hydrolase-fold protein [Chloroflexota bacterium]